MELRELLRQGVKLAGIVADCLRERPEDHQQRIHELEAWRAKVEKTLEEN